MLAFISNFMVGKAMRLHKILFSILLVNLTLAGVSQTGYYWTQQYGTRSILLGGAVIGGVEDLGAVYYNPGRLAIIENPAFLINSNVYELNEISVEDAVGERANLAKSNFSGIPSFVAGTFRLKFAKNHNFAYSILVRNLVDLSFTFRDEITGDIIEEYPGEETFEGEIEYNNRLKEQWFGLTWSYALNPRFSVGVTMNIVKSNQNRGNLIHLRTLTEAEEVAMYKYHRSYDFSAFKLLWKVGLAWELEKVYLGLSITTPSIGLINNASYTYQRYFSGVQGVSLDKDIYENSYQDGLTSKYETPLSIGIGSSFPLGNHKIHISGEWYSHIPRYTMIRANDHIGQTTGDTIRFHVLGEMESVVNLGIGAEIYLSPKVSLYGSFNTDFSAIPKNVAGFTSQMDEFHNSWFRTNLYHFGMGVNLQFRGTQITLGSNYAGASQKFTRPIDFPHEGDDNIFEQNGDATFKWSRWRFVLSFSFPFMEEFAQR